MENYKKIEKVLDRGVSKEALWDEIVQWLPEESLNDFIDDFININDIEID